MGEQSFRDEIRETVSPYKFGGDKMAAALWLLSLDGGHDDETGDAIDWYYWAARFGRRILICDTQGFIYQTRYATEELAREQFALIEQDYAAFDDDDAGGITAEGTALGHRYVMGNVNAYCPKCSDEQGICVLDCDYDLDK